MNPAAVGPAAATKTLLTQQRGGQSPPPSPRGREQEKGPRPNRSCLLERTHLPPSLPRWLLLPPAGVGIWFLSAFQNLHLQPVLVERWLRGRELCAPRVLCREMVHLGVPSLFGVSINDGLHTPCQYHRNSGVQRSSIDHPVPHGEKASVISISSWRVRSWSRGYFWYNHCWRQS